LGCNICTWKCQKETPFIAVLNTDVIFVFFYKIRKQECVTDPIWGAGTSGRGRMWGKGVGGQIYCKCCEHMYINRKMRPVETVPGIRVVG
jgi:hypothetical protein